MIDIMGGVLLGIISGLGIGGGSLLIVYLTSFKGIAQASAGGINLAYYLCSGIPAMISNFKKGIVDKTAMKFCLCGGIITSILSSIIATKMDTEILKKGFSVFLIIVGITLLCTKSKASKT